MLPFSFEKFHRESRITHSMRLLLLFLAFSLISSAPAEEKGKNPLEARLISEMQTIAPGKIFYVGMHLNHPTGYHTYWKHPGIVGVPTSIKWDLPAGVKREKSSGQLPMP
ncbi:MAG: hypothetical protein HC767_00320 [Akkermansiaceae bacterium]|nr:hypothetical protein [Akkermansiaceae bacterium]